MKKLLLILLPFSCLGSSTNSLDTAVASDGFYGMGVGLGYSNVVGAVVSAATNYTLTFGARWPVIVTANTNANISFAGIAAGMNGSIIFNAVTSSANCLVSIPANLITNVNLNTTVTNGWVKVLNFYCIDGTTTNIIVTDGGQSHR